MSSPPPAEAARVVVKTLSRVEVDAESSNQHELHAGRLRAALELPRERTEGTLTIAFHESDDTSPTLDESRYTLTDVRRDTPGREEWHLYYYSDLVQRLARPGDLLVIVRPTRSSSNLLAVIARTGTRVDEDLREAAALGETEVLKQFRQVHPVRPAARAAEAMSADHAVVGALEVRSHPLFTAAVACGKLPRTAEMAAAAQELVAAGRSAVDEPDRFLLEAIDTETAFFNAMEREIGGSKYELLLHSGADFGEVIGLVMSLLQARKSRRGYSLEHHVEGLLLRGGIPYTRGCETEGSSPDFVIPSCAAYHDRAFPGACLRMVGCKSKLRERWGQYRREAARISPKFHISLDPDLGDDLLRKMHGAELRLFMPALLIERYYPTAAADGLIAPIRSLLLDLLEVTAA